MFYSPLKLYGLIWLFLTVVVVAFVVAIAVAPPCCCWKGEGESL